MFVLNLLLECFDKDKKCQQWASDGECENNPTWMLKNCEVSCRACQGKIHLAVIIHRFLAAYYQKHFSETKHVPINTINMAIVTNV